MRLVNIIDRAETQLPVGTDIYSPIVYQCAHDTLYRMIEDGDFVQEESPCFYIYELTMNGRVQTGIGACASVREYEEEKKRKYQDDFG